VRNLSSKRKLIACFAAFCVPASIAAQLEEIVVTAQKRPEPMLEAPLSLVVINEQELLQSHYLDLADLANLAPNLQVLPHPNAGSTLLLFMRGVGNSDEQIIQDPSVAVYLDGVYLSRSQGLASEFLDLERVEVLRGPQGTLYGRNATSGAVNLITKAPSFEASNFSQTLDAGSRGLLRATTHVNTPVTDTVAVKFSYQNSQQEGFVDNAGTGAQRFGDEDRSAWRIDGLWRPSEAFTARLIADKEEASDTPAYVGAIGLLPDRLDAPNAGSAWVSDLQTNDVSSEGITAILDWQLSSEWSLTSIASKRELSDFQYQDLHSGVRGPIAVLVTEAEGTQEQFSQELNLSYSNADESLKAILGAYWFEEDATRNARNTVPGAKVRKLVFGRKISNKAKALYGQVSWRPDWQDQSLELTLGVRASEDERYVLLDRAQQSLPDGPLMFAPMSSVGQRDFDNVSPSLMARYQLSEQVYVYAKQVAGYKSGGFNARASTAARFSEGFDDETLVSRELGIKAELFDRRLRVAATVFQSDYDDIQMNVQSDPNNIVVADVLNAGKASIDGFELDVDALIGEQSEITLRYGWLDASYDVIRDAGGQNVAGNYRFMGAPEHSVLLTWSGVVGASPESGLEYSISYSWRDQFFGSNTTDAGVYKVPAYGLVSGDLSRRLDFDWGTLGISLWGTNLLDTAYYRWHYNAGAGGPIPSGVWGEPRTIGLKLKLEL
jgi:iron complex outermembrane receptor protein